MNMISTYLAVALGGALGAASRFALSQVFSLSSYPIATLLANFIGCLFLGGLFAFWERQLVSEFLRLFLMVGFMGALTTFSTFSADFIMLIEKGQILPALFYILLSVCGGIMLFALSYYGVRQL